MSDSEGASASYYRIVELRAQNEILRANVNKLCREKQILAEHLARLLLRATQDRLNAEDALPGV